MTFQLVDAPSDVVFLKTDRPISAQEMEHIRQIFSELHGKTGIVVVVLPHGLDIANRPQLSYDRVAATNLERCKIWHPGGLIEWSTLEWAGAMAGEAGEAANVAKKIKRVDTNLKGSNTDSREEHVKKFAKELGDVVLYADLCAQREGLRLEDCVTMAFNMTSEKEGFPQRL